MFALGLIGILFTVFRSVYDPQKRSETNDLLMEQLIGKNQADIKTLTKQTDNHIHTIEVKVDAIKAEVNDLTKGLVRLETIINERIPPKH